MKSLDGVLKVKVGICEFGMEAVDPADGHNKPVQKRTAVLINSYEVAQRLRRDCPTDVPTRLVTIST